MDAALCYQGAYVAKYATKIGISMLQDYSIECTLYLSAVVGE